MAKQTPQASGDNHTGNHPFIQAPHRTLLHLSLPVLLSLIAEPLTGLADTGFIAGLGAAPLAALGVGTMTLSSIFWAFNFLGIGTQTEVARAMGGGDEQAMRRMTSLALISSIIFGVLLIAGIWPLMDRLVLWMGATEKIHGLALQYLRVRLFGAPAVLIMIAAFGALRGRQDMRTPLIIATVVNLLNIILDPLLIFGFGPFPTWGVAGAAGASVAAQWTGALSLIWLLRRRIGFTRDLQPSAALKLLRIGTDLFIRTGMITLFLLLATRAATRLGAAEGAAHQAIRQMWMLAALFLDAYAVSGQSLTAFFIGAGQLEQARRVARLVCLWSLATGVALALAMGAGRSLVIGLFVPATAAAPFLPAWTISLAAQPINALAFATDGIHWGTGDFRYLRNSVLLATILCAALLLLLYGHAGFSLSSIWLITTIWIVVRAAAGVLRIWPGIGKAPLGRMTRRYRQIPI